MKARKEKYTKEEMEDKLIEYINKWMEEKGIVGVRWKKRVRNESITRGEK